MGRIKEDFRLRKRDNSNYYYYLLPSMSVWKSTQCKTKSQATTFVKSLIEALKNNTVVEKGITFREYTKDWFVIGKDRRLIRLAEANKPRTERYCKECRWHLDNYIYKCSFADMEMKSITEDEVYDLRSDLLKITTKSMTNHSMNVVKMIFKYAQGKGLIPTNPALFIGSIKEDKKQILIYTKDELDKMFDIKDANKMISIWGSYADFLFEYLELNSGMRNGEVRCLKWKNVDIEAGQISIEENFKDAKGSITGKPKNGTNRFLIMSSNLKFVFNVYKKNYANNVNPSDYVFSYPDGSNWGYTHTIQHHKAGLKKANVEYRKQHTYRHTFNTILKEGGMVADKDIRQTLGWADERIQKNYSHMEVYAAHNVAKAMDCFWNS